MGARAGDRGRGAPELSAPRPVPPLHLVADDEVASRAGFVECAAALLAAGGSALALHLRAHRESGARMYALASALAPVARGAAALLLVNDRVDVALAAGCDGVQLPARGIPVRDARDLLEGRLIGASVHSAAEAAAAADEGADFLLVGTLYPTGSHPGRPGAGPGLLREMGGTGLPRIGIGGVTPGRVPEVLRAGAEGLAVIRGVWHAASPLDALNEYLAALRTGR